MKPLFFNFPEDEETYNDRVMNEQYMIGDELMATPILYHDYNEIEPYFPGNWYQINQKKNNNNDNRYN